MVNYIEIEQQKFTACNYINISVASFFPSFIYDFFIDICFDFEETNYMEKLYGEILKYNFKEQNIIFRLRQQIWSCGICRLKSST